MLYCSTIVNGWPRLLRLQARDVSQKSMSYDRSTIIVVEEDNGSKRYPGARLII